MEGDARPFQNPVWNSVLLHRGRYRRDSAWALCCAPWSVSIQVLPSSRIVQSGLHTWSQHHSSCSAALSLMCRSGCCARDSPGNGNGACGRCQQKLLPSCSRVHTSEQSTPQRGRHWDLNRCPDTEVISHTWQQATLCWCLNANRRHISKLLSPSPRWLKPPMGTNGLVTTLPLSLSLSLHRRLQPHSSLQTI